MTQFDPTITVKNGSWQLQFASHDIISKDILIKKLKKYKINGSTVR